jgi:putative thioredoxin
MSQETYIFEASQSNFSSVVLENSHKLPVVVAFITVSSGPCAAVDHLFSSLAREFSGHFIFARVDVAEQPELRQEFQIENVPTLVVFRDGKAERVELGQLNEDEARALLRDFDIYYESDVMREQAREKHLAGDTPGAIVLLTEAIKSHPSNTRVAMDMVQIFIDIGELEQARSLFERLPEPARESETGKSLQGQLTVAEFAAKTEGLEVLQQRVAENGDDSQARFDLVVCLIAQHDYQEGMEHLLMIIERDPGFRDGAARELMISILNTLKTHSPDLAETYQRKLSNVMAR